VGAPELGALPPWRGFKALLAQVDALLLDEIAARAARPDLDERPDVLSMLVRARDADGGSLDDRELRDQLMTLLLAGHETTATGLAWTFERVLRDPAIHERLQPPCATATTPTSTRWSRRCCACGR
jgi:cytochrome P450